MGCQQRPQLAGALFVDGRAQRVLGAGHGHDRLRSAVEGRSEPVGDQPGVVDRDGDRHEAQGQQHVADRRIAGVLDDHPVARPQMGAQHALDAVHRPRHHGQRLRGNPVGLEPRTGCVEQVGIGGLQPRDPELGVDVDARQRRGDRGQQRRIGESDAEVRAGGDRGRGPASPRGSEGRPSRHPGPATTLADHEPALAQHPVGGADGRRAGPERAGQAADRGQRVARAQRAVADRGLGAGGDLARRRPMDSVILFYCNDDYVL